MKIAVFGLGYVGTVTATVFATQKHEVTGVDVNPAKVAMIERGTSPVIEPDIGELLATAVRNGTLKVTTDATQALRDAQIVFICVGTPPRRNGQADIDALRKVVAEIGRGIRHRNDRPTVVVRSTVLPNVLRETILSDLADAAGGKPGERYGVVVNPEFLREGSSLADFLDPPFTIIGELDARSGDVVAELYRFVAAPLVRTGMTEAAILKYACNAFHAVKIAFANELGVLCDHEGIDGHAVMKIFCRDSKLNLSERYLTPGFPFGGSCLPKDLRALTSRGTQIDASVPLLAATLESNRLHLQRCVERVLATGARRIGVLGLSFKPGTDDLRESPMVLLIEALLGKGRQITVFDRWVSLANLVGSNRDYIRDTLPHVGSLLRDDMHEVIDGAEVVIIGNRDPEFDEAVSKLRGGQVLIEFNRPGAFASEGQTGDAAA